MKSRVLLLVSVLMGGALRFWLAFHDDGIYWPDEIFQSFEPAHHLTFGYGLLPWEFIQGTRSWVLPGLISIPMRLGILLGWTHPENYIGIVKSLFALSATACIYAVYRAATRLGANRMDAALGALVFALMSPAIYFAPRALSETASTLPAITALGLILPKSSDRYDRVIGGSMIGLATLFRFQSIFFILPVVMIWVYRRGWKELAEILLTFTLWLLLSGLIDRWTWGYWFHSTAAYLKFNLSNLVVENKQFFGTEGPFYYVKTLFSSTGVLFLLLAALMTCSIFTNWEIFLVSLFFLLVHSLISHKEFRYLYPFLPLVCIASSLGLSYLRTKRYLYFRGAAGLLAALSIFSGIEFHKLTAADIGQANIWQPDSSAYDRYGSVNRLLLIAHQQSSLCGLKIENVPMTLSGGMTYLHRHVPLYDRNGPRRDSEKFNYVITTAPSTGETELAADGAYHLRKLSNPSCKPDGSYSWRLN